MAADAASDARLRMAEFLAPLSLITDLGMGEPDDQALRATLLSLTLADRLGLDTNERSDVYYTTLLRHIGCTATSHDESMRFLPDEIAIRPNIFATDFTRPREVLSVTLEMMRRARLAARPGLVLSMATSGHWGRRVELAVCEVATMMARRLGMSDGVQRAVFEIRERWDGRGEPRRIGGEDVAIAARVALVSAQAVCLDSLFGAEAAAAIVRERAGDWFDPAVAEAFEAVGFAGLADLGGTDLLPATIEAEPGTPLRVPATRLDEITRAFADMTDLKTPWLHGHSTGVADLAERAATSAGLPREGVTDVRRAGLLHDLGRIAIPTGIWDKPGPLSGSEWEHVRLHAYRSERVLARCAPLAAIAFLAGMHHERQDGSGYHRQLAGSGVPLPARLIAAADALRAMTEPRPYREAWSLDRAGSELTGAAAQGRFDPEAVAEVCAAAGVSTGPGRVRWPEGLTEREVEVLRLLAEGLSNRDVGKQLFISPRTAEHHVQNIYGKIGCSTRAAATMFAMEHGLLR